MRPSSTASDNTSISRAFHHKLLNEIQKCLLDLPSDVLKPIVGIEPIESPSSPLEDQPGLAQAMITALLNVYRSTFQPSQNQLLQVHLAIPWHRYDIGRLDLPQKLSQYTAKIQWTEQTLKEFINKRIQWEFRHVGRHSEQPDSWSVLFTPRVLNDHTDPPLFEESFDYVLRHTHHRARDLQRFAREAVLTAARQYGVSVDEVLLGKKGRIGEQILRETVRTESNQMTRELLAEGSRRFAFLHRLVDAMRGIPVPFNDRDLKRRTDGVCDFVTTVTTLWEAGWIGVAIHTQSPQVYRSIADALGDAGYRRYALGKKAIHVWSLFSYNWDGDCIALLERFGDDVDGSASFVMHPKVFQHLLARVHQKWPVGA